MTHEAAGKRVQIPAWRDEWMRGDRYGTVIGVVPAGKSKAYPKSEVYRVRLDKSGRVLRIQAQHVEAL